MDNDWKEFELAVSAFLKATDPNNNVKHNVYLPDKHTKKRRQRDVFLTTNLCGFLPLNILVSCKKYKRKLNQQDIDAFNGELISSGAHKGVIYSYSGFNENATEKCKVLGISCCKLYLNQPADLPEVLLYDYFCCIPKGMISLMGPIDKRWNLNIWEDLLFSKDSDNDFVIDSIEHIYMHCEKNSLDHPQGKFPISCYTISEIPHKYFGPLKIKTSCIWQYYRNRFEASLVSGSYSFSDKTFNGEQTGPVIDIKKPPGDHWTLMEKIPENCGSSYMVMIMSGGSINEALLAISKSEIVIELGETG